MLSATTKMSAVLVGGVGALTIGGALLFGEMTEPSGAQGASPLLALGDEKPDAEEKVADAPAADAVEKDAYTEEKMDAEERAEEAPRSSVIATFRQLSAKDLKVYQALDKEIVLEFPDNTLMEFIDYVRENSSIPIRIDNQALTDAGLDGEARIVFVGQHTLGDSLAMLLSNVNQTQLDYYVERGVLHITTHEKMGTLTRLRFYDLFEGDSEQIEGGGAAIVNLRQAVQDYALVIDGGEGMVQVTSLGDCLAIRAPVSRHHEIEDFITGATNLAASRRLVNRPLPVVPEHPVQTEQQQAAGAGGGGGFF